MEEEDDPELWTLDEIEVMAVESTQSLRNQTGADLPRLAPTPLQTVKRVECVPLKIELPLGSLFYPCCGSDIKHALKSFESCVTDCHFADPYNPPHGRRRPAVDLTPLFIPHVETVVVGIHEHRQLANLSCPVYSHRKDGLLTLIDDVPLLSVFYYAVTATAKEEVISDGLNLFCFTRSWPDCLTVGSLLPMGPTVPRGIAIGAFRVLCVAE